MCLPEVQVVTVNQRCCRLYSYFVLVPANCLLLWLLTGEQKLKEFMVTVACLHHGLYRLHPVSWVYSVNFQNMVGAGEVDEDLEVETKEECEKYGKVGKCVIFEVRDNPSLFTTLKVNWALVLLDGLVTA